MEKDTKIISFANQKGGSTKSTITHMVAQVLISSEYNKEVLLLEADGQPTLSNTFNRQLKENADNPSSAKKMYNLIRCEPNELKLKVQENYGKYDYIFIDFPGSFMATGIKRGIFYVIFFLYLYVMSRQT